MPTPWPLSASYKEEADSNAEERAPSSTMHPITRHLPRTIIHSADMTYPASMAFMSSASGLQPSLLHPCTPSSRPQGLMNPSLGLMIRPLFWASPAPWIPVFPGNWAAVPFFGLPLHLEGGIACSPAPLSLLISTMAYPELRSLHQPPNRLSIDDPFETSLLLLLLLLRLLLLLLLPLFFSLRLLFSSFVSSLTSPLSLFKLSSSSDYFCSLARTKTAPPYARWQQALSGIDPFHPAACIGCDSWPRWPYWLARPCMPRRLVQTLPVPGVISQQCLFLRRSMSL